MARPNSAMQRTSFWLALPLIALAGFALSFYSPRGAQAGTVESRARGSAEAAENQHRWGGELMRVSDRPAVRPAPEKRSNEGAAQPTNEQR